MESTERDQLIAQYRDGYRAVAEALLRITPEELDARSAPGRWSAREIVHHLADSEMAAAVRLRNILAHHRPTITADDQNEVARRLHYDRPHEAALELFRYVRETTAEILERMSSSDWTREAVHSVAGTISAQQWLGMYAAHAHRHARQIRSARDAARPPA